LKRQEKKDIKKYHLKTRNGGIRLWIRIHLGPMDPKKEEKREYHALKSGTFYLEG